MIRDDFVKSMRTINWKHALGQVLLIVASVLIALEVNNWNNTRQAHRLELVLLTQLHDALRADQVALRAADRDFVLRAARMEALREHITHQHGYADTLARSFGAIIGIWETHLNRSPYEVLKARGLDLISDDSLRIALVSLYDQAYANLAVSEEDDRSVVFEVVRPYFISHFRNIQFRESATPLDYDAVSRDQVFRNILDYRLISLRANGLGPTEAADSAVSALLERLSRLLGKH